MGKPPKKPPLVVLTGGVRISTSGRLSGSGRLVVTGVIVKPVAKPVIHSVSLGTGHYGLKIAPSVTDK